MTKPQRPQRGLHQAGERPSKDQASASIESRVAAASALAAVALELEQCAAGSVQTASCFPDTLLDSVAVPVLLLAMQDYTSDNR